MYILTFTQLATYSASVVKSNSGIFFLGGGRGINAGGIYNLAWCWTWLVWLRPSTAAAAALCRVASRPCRRNRSVPTPARTLTDESKNELEYILQRLKIKYKNALETLQMLHKNNVTHFRLTRLTPDNFCDSRSSCYITNLHSSGPIIASNQHHHCL